MISTILFKTLSLAQSYGINNSTNSHAIEIINTCLYATFGKNAKIPYSIKCITLYKFMGSSNRVLSNSAQEYG